jgi:hypothetical protein
LRDFLEEEAGIDVWLDARRLEAGDDWDHKIRRNIKNCSYFLQLISTAATDRDEGYYRREWSLAVERAMDFADSVPFIIPVAIDDTAEDADGSPSGFYGRNGPGCLAVPAPRRSAAAWSRWCASTADARMIELADDLTHSLDAENPWPGLMPFTEATRAFFHGRDAEAAELLRRVRRERLTILFGQSGLGKTSLLFAGLFPRLRTADFLPVYLRLDLVNVRLAPVAQIKQSLAENLVEHGIEGRPPRSDETLWEYFHDKETEFWSRRNRLVTPVLVLDQFEEIFTLGHGVPSVDVVIDELVALVENRPPGSVRAAFEDDPEAARRYDFAKESCKLVFALREDFLPDLEGLRRRMPSIVENRMRLTRMDGRQARDAILASGSHLVGPGVTEKVIAFVAASHSHSAGEAVDEAELAGLEIEPALLSIVCSELNNKRLRLGHAQITPDLLEGAQQEIVAQFYESSLAGIDPAVKLFIEEQLLTSEGYRDTRPLAEALREPGVTRTDVDRLVARRLLRIEERFGTQWIELTHDLLTGVIRQRRDLRREQTLAAQEAEARAQAERERAERAEAEAARERKEREAQTALAREAAERERLARRLVRRTQIALAATVVALVAAVGAGLYAWDQRRLAEEQATVAAHQRQLADQRAAEGSAAPTRRRSFRRGYQNPVFGHPCDDGERRR